MGGLGPYSQHRSSVAIVLSKPNHVLEPGRMLPTLGSLEGAQGSRFDRGDAENDGTDEAQRKVSLKLTKMTGGWKRYFPRGRWQIERAMGFGGADRAALRPVR